METSRYLRKGSKVIICLIPGDYAVTPGMLEYNGEGAIISKICRKRTKGGKVIQGNKPGELKKITHAESSVYGYELEDVVSPYGIQYTFTRDMIK
jgi:hypothetical protein